MEFLFWHYTDGVTFYINSWLAQLNSYFHYFSLPLLLKSLFSPWKRLVEEDKSPGFDLSKFLNALSYNVISRVIGAIVRTTLLIAGIIVIIFIFLGGIAGFLFWIIIPLFGYPVYKRIRNQPEIFAQELVSTLPNDSESKLRNIFDNPAGVFVLKHIGASLEEMAHDAKYDKLKFLSKKPKGYADVLSSLVKKNIWSEDFLRKKGLKQGDIIRAALWWDKDMEGITSLEPSGLSGSGVALDLLFGYTPNLDKYSINLSTPRSYAHHLIGREKVVLRMERTLTGGSSVVVVGDPGVGKRTVVLEFAHRAAQGQLGKKMAYRKVYELDYNSLLAGSADLNTKKTILSQILLEAAAAGNIILMVRDIHRLTNASVEGYDFTDVFENHLEKKDLKIIAVTTPSDYERFITPNMRLRKYLETIEVTPPTNEEALLILLEAASDWERKKDIVITVPSLRKILEESDRYITETPYPEKALEILDAVIMYADQNQLAVITSKEVNIVLSEKTGVSFARLTKKEKERLGNLEDIIHKRLVNQDIAVELISKALRAKTVGVVKESRPVGSFLFLGPTGVGKTETAKVLARVYYGSEEKIIRFDMAEYTGEQGLERLIGSARSEKPGELTTAIKRNPASLLLLDEFEKATSEVFNLFLALLDEGYITDARGNKIIGRHLFIIATSNAAAEHIRQLVKKTTKPGELQKNVVEYVLQKGIYTPELLNRFDGVVVYEPLRNEHLIKIAKILLTEFAKSLRKKGVKLIVTDDVVAKLAQDGFDPAFGARPMKRIINLVLGDLLGRAILKGEIKEGQTIRLMPGAGKEDFGWENYT